MNKDSKSDSKITTHRVVTELDRRELEFLDKLGTDALFSNGHKLSHNEILRILVDMAMDMELSWESVEAMKEALKEKKHQEQKGEA